MEFREVLEKYGVNYEEVLKRFMNNESLMKKFMKKFMGDNSFENAQAAINAKDAEKALTCCHTLKGISANLGFAGLNKTASDIVTLLRNEKEEEAYALAPQLEAEYDKTVKMIREIA